MHKKPIALVTGGAGFIGSHMVDKLLDNNFHVRIIDDFTGGTIENINHHKKNPDLDVYKKDITKLDENDPFFKDLSYVFHFAGKGDIVPSIENPETYMNINVQGTVKILENCRQSQLSKFIYAASSSCYGLASVPTKENHPISPEYPYALSKYLGELSVMHWGKVYKMPINSIRIFNAYGIRAKTTAVYGAVFGVFFKQKLANKAFTVVGDGSQSRDFLYVTDVTNAFFSLSQSIFVNKIYNLGAGNPKSINDIINIIGGNIIYIPKRPGEPDCTFADITKISNDLKWKPLISLEKGIRLMLNEIDRWENAPLWDVKKINEATKTWFKYMKQS